MSMAYKEVKWAGRAYDGVPIYKRIEAFLYLVGFPPTFVISKSDTGEMKALQRLKTGPD